MLREVKRLAQSHRAVSHPLAINHSTLSLEHLPKSIVFFICIPENLVPILWSSLSLSLQEN